MSKIDKPLIKVDAHLATYSTLPPVPAMQALSADINNHLTEAMTLSGDAPSVGDIVILNDNETYQGIEQGVDTVTSPHKFDTSRINSGGGESVNWSYDYINRVGFVSWIQNTTYIPHIQTITLSGGTLYGGNTYHHPTTPATSGYGCRYSGVASCYDDTNNVTMLFAGQYQDDQTPKFPVLMNVMTPTITGQPTEYGINFGVPVISSVDVGNNVTDSSLVDAIYDSTYDVAVVSGHDTVFTVSTQTSGGSLSAYYLEDVASITGFANWPVMNYDGVNDQYIVMDTSSTKFVSLSGAGVPYITNTQAYPAGVTISEPEFDFCIVGNSGGYVALFDDNSRVWIGQIVGDSITWGEENILTGKLGGTIWQRIVWHEGVELAVAYYQYTSSYRYYYPMSINFETLSLGTLFGATIASSFESISMANAWYEPEEDTIFITASDGTPNAGYVRALTIGDTNFTDTNQFLGLMQPPTISTDEIEPLLRLYSDTTDDDTTTWVDTGTGGITIAQGGSLPVYNSADVVRENYGATSIFVDNTSNQALTTNTVDYLQNYGGDWSVDWLIYPLEAGGSSKCLGWTFGSWFWSNWSTTYGFKIQTGAGQSAFLYLDSDPTLNEWSHLAFDSYKGIVYAYVNGVRQTNTINYVGYSMYNGSTYANFGKDNIHGINQTKGYYDNFRMIKDSRYKGTASFDPPTSPTDDRFYETRIGRHGFMDTNQSGLTINTNYYVDRWGNLWTTDASDRAYVGKAVSDTEIIIKG